MKYLHKLVSVLLLPILLIILTNCNSNVGSSAATSGINGAVSAENVTDVTELTVTENYAYGSMDSTHNTGIKGIPSIVLNFNAALDKSTVTSSNIYMQDINGKKIALNSLQLNDNAQSVILTPEGALIASATYAVIVTTGVKSVNNLTLKNNVTFPFTMNSSSNVRLPTVALLNPYGSSNNIAIAFSEAMNGKYINPTYINLYSGTSTSGTPLNIRISGPTSTTSDPKCTTDYRVCPIIITNRSTGEIITPKGTYTLRVTTVLNGINTITDLAGNPLVPDNGPSSSTQYRHFTFTVADPASITTVNMTNPTNKQIYVTPSTTITLQFSNIVYGVESAITLHSGSATGPLLPIAKIEDKDDYGKTYIITPASNLPVNSTIYVVMGTGISDTNGNWLSETSFSFSTSGITTP